MEKVNIGKIIITPKDPLKELINRTKTSDKLKEVIDQIKKEYPQKLSEVIE